VPSERSNPVEPITEAQIKKLILQLWHPEQVAQLAKQMASWRRIAFLLIPLALLGWILFAHKSSQASVVPVIVTVDLDGHVIWSGPPDTWTVNDRQVMGVLDLWMRRVRSRGTDITTTFREWKLAATMATGPVTKMLSDYMMAEDPRIPKNASVQVDYQPVMHEKRGELTYRLMWKEHRVDQARYSVTDSKWGADLSVVIKQPTDQMTTNLNPFGIYVKSLSWWQEVE
jgi:type IV secretory pathway TrbF-like protein